MPFTITRLAHMTTPLAFSKEGHDSNLGQETDHD